MGLSLGALIEILSNFDHNLNTYEVWEFVIIMSSTLHGVMVRILPLMMAART